MSWSYDANNFDPNTSFEVPPVGKHRLRIAEVEEQTSKSNNPMIKVAFEVSGFTGKVFHYFVEGIYFQRNIDPFFDSFGIKPGDFNVLGWRGKVGAATIKHEMYNGSPQARIGYFILKSKQGELPAWVEKGQVASLREDPAYAEATGTADTPF